VVGDQDLETVGIEIDWVVPSPTGQTIWVATVLASLLCEGAESRCAKGGVGPDNQIREAM
jgi:hypothetical protein